LFGTRHGISRLPEIEGDKPPEAPSSSRTRSALGGTMIHRIIV
jgi:hypothetical protein